MRIASSWQALSSQAARLCEASLPGLIAADPTRASDFALQVGPIYANFARQRYDRDALAVLHELARERQLDAALRRLFDGGIVNVSEQRPALHTALRSSLGQGAVAAEARALALAAHGRMAELVAALDASEVSDVVSIGIGGSDLGPRLATEALAGFDRGRFRLHFLNNADAHPVQALLQRLDPARTAAILVSKSFGTQETLLNGAIVRDWIDRPERLFAVTAHPQRAQAFGVPEAQVLPMWDWVGGRYSLWSAVGFPVALALGMPGFEALLAGAAEMDVHVASAAPERNLAYWHALSVIWNRNGLGYDTHAVMPYDERLALLPAYLQQLVMESLGKSVCADGGSLPVATVPVLWGGTGTSCQHSFFQALHQGTDTVPADFVGVIRPAHTRELNHRVLLANLLAQTEALANGQEQADSQRRHAGNRPSTLFLLDELSPAALGGLLAMYEHSVFLQASLWGINAFDQWGVELGKHLAERLQPALADAGVAVSDPVSRELLAQIRRR